MLVKKWLSKSSTTQRLIIIRNCLPKPLIIKDNGSKWYGRENVKKKMRDLTRQFGSYIKHKERGKKDRRPLIIPP